MEGPADVVDVVGVQNRREMPADDVARFVAKKIFDLPVGEGKIPVFIEDVDEVRAAFDEGSIFGF